MIYNIWLNGSTSKFTFFMRMKNLINEQKKMKIKPEMKMFLLVMMQKLNGYYNHSQKRVLNKWQSKNKFYKHLILLTKNLSQFENKVNSQMEKDALVEIKDIAYFKKLAAKYLSKRLSNLTNNLKLGFDTWKTIPDIRKNKGRIQLSNLLRNKLKVNNEAQRETFAAFKSNKIEGKAKKSKFLAKYFAKDYLYLSIFMNIWSSGVRT